MTKRELVQAALNEIGIADYEFDITPEELSSGVRRLNTMLSQWSLKGVRVPYNFVGGTSDDSGLPATFHEAVIMNLAIRLAPSYGKEPSMGVMAIAKQALSSIYAKSALPQEIRFPSMPIGAGYKSVDTVFTDPVDTSVDILNGLDDFQNFSGDSTAIQRGDIGTLIQISISGSADISEVVSSSIYYRKPSGATGQWASVVNGDYIEYTTVAGDIDETGVWYLQAQFDLGAWKGTSKITSITVAESLTP